MCPECGSPNSRVRNTSHDPEGHRIRMRDCEDCGHRFPTVEIAFPFSFHEADEGKRHAPAYSARIKVPEYEPSRFAVEPITTPGGHPTVTVRLVRSRKYPRCRKGIHVMRGANIYVHPTTGHKTCNACRRIAANARYHNAWSKMPESMKEEIRAKERARFSKRREYKREWMRRKRAEEKAA